MAVSAGITAAVLPGDLDFSAGGMDVTHLIGTFVKDVTSAGVVTLQNAQGQERQVQIAGVSGGGAVDVLTTPVDIAQIGPGPAGVVGRVTLTNPGMNYEGPPTVTISGGGGSGAMVSAFIDTTGAISTLRLRNTGSGYTSNPTVTITGAGSGASGYANQITSIGTVTITNGGSGYTSVPTVTFSGGNPRAGQATGTAQISGGQVTGITLNTHGGGYISAPTVTISGGGGSGATATAAVDAISNIRLTSRGSGYVSVPTAVFVGGGGTGATLRPQVTRSGLNIFLGEGGTGYTQNPIATVSGGSGSGAYGICTVENGQVTQISALHPGSGFVSGETVTVTITGGGGSGATATAVANSGGWISAYTITNGGSGYTNPAQIVVTSNDPGSGATATADITPFNWTQVLTPDQWMDKTTLFALFHRITTAGVSAFQWIIPTYFLRNSVVAQGAPVQLYRSTQNIVGTAAYTDTSTGLANSLFERPGGFNAPFFYVTKDTNNNLWITTTGDSIQVTRIGAS